jgi:histidine triad (HIT) family protein
MPTVVERLPCGEPPCANVDEEDLVFAFMDATDDEAAALMRAARRVALAVQAAFAPAGVTVLQASRPALPHLHLHVLLRHASDGVELGWPRKEPGIERLRERARRLQPHL